MAHDLESPFVDGQAAWDQLYLAREDDVVPNRPIFTGDVFDGLPLPGTTGRVKPRSVMIVQHPCSMRTEGVTLAPRLLVAEVTTRRPLTEVEWDGYANLMPLPDLRPSQNGARRHAAADFDSLHLVAPDELTMRAACLSAYGVNLLLQRWVHHSSRVVVPTVTFHEQTLSVYEEADLIEEWCLGFEGDEIPEAMQECLAWLRDPAVVPSRQAQLRNPQAHSSVWKALRAAKRTAQVPGGRSTPIGNPD